MKQKVTKAIIPAAGLGTRFLPQTKAMPKEMLPIIDKPVIQIVVEELVAAGVTDIIIVTGALKRSIEDHFDRSVELESALIEKGKVEAAEQIKQIAELANFVYVRQKGEPMGNARPILNTAHLIADEPFFYLFPDDFFLCEGPSSVEQMLETFEETGKTVIALREVERSDADKYGMARIDELRGNGTVRVRELIEKPGPERTPSTLASVSGYILTPEILPLIDESKVGLGGEIVVADSINQLAQVDEVYGRKIEGVYHDAGDKLSYLQAIVDVALKQKAIAEPFEEFLRARLQ